MVTAVAAAMLAAAPLALAEDPPKPEQLKQMYDDTLAQLKNAQERKTQLAAENEQLKAKLADLQKQLDASKARNSDLEKQAAGYAEKTFFLRSHYAAWQEFLQRNPRLQIRWKTFLGNDAITPRRDVPVVVDPEWPWSAQS